MRIPKGSKLIRADPCRVWRAPVKRSGIVVHFVDEWRGMVSKYLQATHTITDGMLVLLSRVAVRPCGGAVVLMYLIPKSPTVLVATLDGSTDYRIYAATPEGFVL